MLFDRLLSFLGIIKEKTEKSQNEESSFHKKNIRQGRTITRNAYFRTYNKDLSPNRHDIETGNIILNENFVKQSSADKFKKVLFIWTYRTFIFCLLSIQPIYQLYNITVDNRSREIVDLAGIVFSLIPPTQYILFLIYFSSDHFESFLSNRKRELVYFIIFSCIINIVINLIIIWGVGNVQENDGEFPRFGIFSRPIKILTTLFLLFSWFYGKTVVYTNLVCFCFVFYKHTKIIQNFVKKLEKTKDINTLSIDSITNELLYIRHDLEESIDMFKNIFSIFTILGAIGFGFFLERIKTGNFLLFPWTQFVIYVIIQIIFLLTIIRMNFHKEILIGYIRQPKFVDRFLTRYTAVDIQKKFEDNQLIILNMVEENATTIDWIVLNSLSNETWTEFKVMGIDISDGSLIKKGIVMVTLIVAFMNYIST